MGAYLAIKSKNLLDFPNETKTLAVGAYYTNSFTAYKTLPSKTYTLAWDFEFVSASTVRVYASLGCGYWENGYSRDIITNLDYPNKTSGRMCVSFTTPSDLLDKSTTGNAFLAMRFLRVDSTTQSHELKISNVMLVEGSYTASTMPAYEPYYTYKPVKALTVTGNKFDINGGYTKNGSNISIDGDKIVDKPVAGGAYEYIRYNEIYPAGTYRIYAEVDTEDSMKSYRPVIMTDTPVDGMTAEGSTQYGGWWKVINSGESFTFTAKSSFQLKFIFAVSGANGGKVSKTYRNITLQRIGAPCTLRMRPTTFPDGYQRVEYIESTGTQYIDTGVNAKDTLSFEIGCTYSDNTVIGVQDNNSEAKCLAVAGTSKEYWVRFLSNGGYNFGVSLDYQNTYTISITADKACLYHNGGKAEISYQIMTNSVNYPLYIFARNINGSASSFSNIKLYSCKIYDNGKLVRNFIPCYRKDDEVIGLLDIVSGVFFTNQGTGKFSKGADI